MNADTIDLHIHAGIERPVPMNVWVDTLLGAGRRTLGLLDHYELYLKSDQEYQAHRERKGFPDWYANGLFGFREFCTEARLQAERTGTTMLVGLEVYHGDFPDARADFLTEVDFVGCHISKTESFEPWGDFLLHASRKLSETAQRHDLIGVLFHPFEHSFWHHQHGQTPDRGLHIIEPDNLRRFADEIASLDICIEINWGSDSRLLHQPDFLEPYLPVIDALRTRDVRFWLGSDVHHDADAPYKMQQLCDHLGITETDIWLPTKHLCE